MDRLARVALALAALAPSCVQLQWERDIAYEPVDALAIGALQPGVSDLGTCLAELGAPLYVWEYRGDGVALAFGALHATSWGFGVSVQVSESASASFDFDEGDAQTRGWVLFFDSDWKLVALSEGNLRAIAAGFARQPPASIEE